MSLNNKTSTKAALKAVLKLVDAGWTRNGYYATVDHNGKEYPRGCYCLAGAIGKVCEDTHVVLFSGAERVTQRVYNAVLGALPKQYQKLPEGTEPDDAIVAYNDKPSRTIGQVREVLLRAIEQA